MITLALQIMLLILVKLGLGLFGFVEEAERIMIFDIVLSSICGRKFS